MVELFLNGKKYPLSWAGSGIGYLKVVNMTPGDLIEVNYVIPEFTQTFIPSAILENTGEVRVKWAGNCVFSAEPAGRYLSLF
jgi:hypothetical protein